MDKKRIFLPNDWRPRPHQRKLWMYFEGGGKRGVAVWHRRAGKDSTAINLTCSLAHDRVGTYWHMLPEAKQGRKVIWDAIDRDGRRVIDQAFPESIREATNGQEMQIKLKSGSVWQVVGSDNYNSLVGANPVGVVFSEYSVAKPAAWDYIRPILAENGGWALFIYTPRGKNHGKKLFDLAGKNPDWFRELLTVEDTLLIPPDVIQAERDAGMSDEMVAQEFFCSWEGSVVGSIYVEQLRQAREEGRIGKIGYDRRFPVQTFWDLGHGDDTAIVCHQHVQTQDRFLRGTSQAGQDVAYFVDWLRQTGYVFGKHYVPHDAKNVTLASKGNPLGSNVVDQLVTAGVPRQDIVVCRRVPQLWAGIGETRARFGTAWFDEVGCEGLLDALGQYHKEWDEDRQCYADRPYHDWSSNYADAFRQWAQEFSPTAGLPSFTLPAGKAVARLPGRGDLRVIGNRKVGY